MSRNREQLYEGHINMYPPQQEQGSNDYSALQVRNELSQSVPYQDKYASRNGVDMQGSVLVQHERMNAPRTPATESHIVEHHPGEWITSPSGSASALSNDSPASQGVEGNKVNSSPEKVRNRPFSEFSEEALLFYKVYEATIRDSPNFTPDIQLQWCETLLEYAFKPTFISRYSINAEKLKRHLTPQEMQRNKTTLLEHALKVLAKLIKLKHPPSLYLMGTLYSNQPYLNIQEEGIVPKSDQKALEYYKSAAKLDNADGCYRAGVCYEFGKGIPEGVAKRESLLRAVQFYERGSMLTKDPVGSTCCMFKLGTFQLNGLVDDESQIIIVNQDVLSAIQWFERAIENDTQSSSQAMFELAKVYEQDMLSLRLRNAIRSCQITRDPVKALDLYIKCACKYRYPLAQWKLGHCYEFAELNLPYSPEKSMAWYYLAASSDLKGSPMAMMGLSGWYLTGSPNVLAPNDTEAFNWAYRASQASDGRLAKAEYALAVFYEVGIGCAQDLNKALEYHRRAAKLGHKKAIMRLSNAVHDGQVFAT